MSDNDKNRYGYSKDGTVQSEEVTFTITCTMRKRWAAQFRGMLDYMERLGGVGSSRKVALYSDGDGDFRPKFQWSEDIPPAAPQEGGEVGDPPREFQDALFDAG